MIKKIKLLNRQQIFQKAIFKIEEAEFQQQISDDEWSDVISRLSIIRSDAIAVLVHNIDTDELIFTDQFRFSTYDKTGGWILELSAGMIDEGEEPLDAVKREILEEIGYTVNHAEPIYTFYLSPGTVSERIFLYYAQVRNQDQQAVGGGLVEEGEFIQVVTLPIAQAFEMLKTGEIMDSKTIIGLQWLASRPDLWKK